jgi:hypothetical protein
MKRKMLFQISCSVVIVLLGLWAAYPAQAQDLCTFNQGVKQGPAPPPPPQAVPPYFLWRPGNQGDQSTVAGQHSGLVGWKANVDDVTFAQITLQAIAGGGNNYPSVPLVYVFGECYGGGMIDDLAANVVFNPMSIVSASFFNQTASYPMAGGNGTDFLWAYLRALGKQKKPTAQSVAAQAATDDPFGWAAKPNRARVGEKLGSETPEYWSQNVMDISLLRAQGEVNSVILWAGQPEVEDDKQLSQLIVTLLNLGYDKDNIVVYFGSGFYSPQKSQLVATMKNNNFDPTHLREADPTDLAKVLAQWAFPANVANPSQFFFFVAADHGCNNAFMPQEKTGNGGGAIPQGGDDAWGNDGGSMLPYPPRY